MFSVFLFLERDFLCEISCTFFCQDFDVDVVKSKFFRLCSVLVAEDFRFVRVDSQTRSLRLSELSLLAEYFRLVWVDSQTICFRVGLEFTEFFTYFSNDVKKNHTSSANFKQSFVFVE